MGVKLKFEQIVIVMIEVTETNGTALSDSAALTSLAGLGQLMSTMSVYREKWWIIYMRTSKER